ncbi:protein D2-like [Bicyclus anynana]|uniref:Protein D2-like n=1 Tax=Bicyclus anynana TaxID=110368 RepID=A0ABM3LXT0_BICAN|nr:protein D2-like [Bicyclus anynana]
MDEMEEAFMNSSIVPAIVPVVPNNTVTVSFGNKEVNLGNFICAYDTSIMPFIYFEPENGSLYALFYINADVGFAFSGSRELVYLNYLVVNIPDNNVYEGDQATPYQSYLPFPGAGPTRNLFMVYKQNATIDVAEIIPQIAGSSYLFNMTDFVLVNQLGDPIAGNFFLTQLTNCNSKEEESNEDSDASCSCCCQ